MTQHDKTKRLVESGLMMALATILSFLTVFQLPYGGAITAVSLLPMLLLCWRQGMRWGFAACFAYSFLRIFIGATTTSVFQGLSLATLLGAALIDYILGYLCLDLGGLFKGKLKNVRAAFTLSVLVACLLKFACHILSGFLFYGQYASWFFLEAGFPGGEEIYNSFHGSALALVYSVIYNGTYMLPETALTVLAAWFVGGFRSGSLLEIRQGSN